MKGDITRTTFDRFQHYTRVLMQQGRVQLDADWNEQAEIAQHYLRTVTADLIGPHGGPLGDCGFEIIVDPGRIDAMRDRDGQPLAAARAAALRARLVARDLVIGAGRYYVNGMLCENDEPIAFSEQAGYPFDPASTLGAMATAGQVLFYLDVWERHLSYVEAGAMREVALGGPDTASRVQLVWQVKALASNGAALSCSGTDALAQLSHARMRARAQQPETVMDACVINPEARYRGAENQLYRIEIHRAGAARATPEGPIGATFKWSRENGSVVFPILTLADDKDAKHTRVTLAASGRDQVLGLGEGDWVEIVDDDYALQNRAGQLLKVQALENDGTLVVLEGVRGSTVGADPARHPLLRRWDHDGADGEQGALAVTEAAGQDGAWIDIEDGVQIQFPALPGAAAGTAYRTGDYWLVPARSATGDVEWPRTKLGSSWDWAALAPRGVRHFYAPLVLAEADASGAWSIATPGCRRAFAPLATLPT